jgi:hypothetical protein
MIVGMADAQSRHKEQALLYFGMGRTWDIGFGMANDGVWGVFGHGLHPRYIVRIGLY